MLENKCDCQLSQHLAYFCVQNKCNINRRLCADCKTTHLSDHDIRELANPQNLKSLSLNQSNPSKRMIQLELKITKNKLHNGKEEFMIRVGQILQYFNKAFDKYFMFPLELLEGTLDYEQQKQKRQLINKSSTSKDELEQIAYEIRSLNRQNFKDKQWIRNLCIELQMEYADLRIQLEKTISDNVIKLLECFKNKMESLNPLNDKWINKIKQKQAAMNINQLQISNNEQVDNQSDQQAKFPSVFEINESVSIYQIIYNNAAFRPVKSSVRVDINNMLVDLFIQIEYKQKQRIRKMYFKTYDQRNFILITNKKTVIANFLKENNIKPKDGKLEIEVQYTYV